MFAFSICWQTKGDEPRILGVTERVNASWLPAVGDFVSAKTNRDITHTGKVIMREMDFQRDGTSSYCITVEV